MNLKSLESWLADDQEKAVELLKEFHYLFALNDLELGCTSEVKHTIKLTDPVPFKQRYCRIPPHQFQEVKNHLEEMLKVGAIHKSVSPWASPVVLVRKKDGSLRFCIDLRKLNSHTVRDAYSLPRIEESLDCLNGACIFTSLDLKSGYWQVLMDEDSIPLTAFTVGPLGFYECVRMPFGLTNAPATFQRLMESCLGDLHLQQCIIYLDDIIIFSKTPSDHLERLRAVFLKLEKANLRLKPSKCEFFRERIEYLGHIVSKAGIETNPKKIQKVLDWPVPKTVTSLRGFLGLCNYYRKFIKNYSRKALPLYKLLTGLESKEQKKKGSSHKLDWTKEHEACFNLLKEACTSTPVLAYADYTKPFRVHTDASEIGLGAILYQDQADGTTRVIAYASRSLSKSEKRYHASKLEFLCLKWAITDQFHEYLYGGSFEVCTDNNPLTYILTTAKLDATGQRWVASLANYDFKIKYRSGKQNVDADSLSRIPWDAEQVQAVLKGGCATSCELLHLIGMKGVKPEILPKLSRNDWLKEQRADGSIAKAIRLVTANKHLQYKCELSDSDEFKTIMRFKKNLVLKDGLLYRRIDLKGHDRKVHQFLLPSQFRVKAIQGMHDDMGHLGMDRTLNLLQDRFFWYQMNEDVRAYIRKCDRCLRFKTKPEKEEMSPILATYPLELVHLDYLTIGEKSLDKMVNILVITDHFTRYAQAYITPKQTAHVTAKVFWEQFLVHYGWPSKIISDQGRSFENKLFKELCSLAQVQKIHTSPYHLEMNGSCEQFNSTLIGMLGTLGEEDKLKWSEWVPTMTHAYNSTKCQVTGFTPYFLMFGQEPILPIDLEFGISNPMLVDSSHENMGRTPISSSRTAT